MSGRLFDEFSELSSETKSVLKRLGFQRATPVQEATIPLFVRHKDVAVDACTGSGKTLAFVLPIIERLRRLETPLQKHQVGALVVSPTRELARQIRDVAQPFVTSVAGLTSALLVGGTDPTADVASLRSNGGHILIGTPGRLDDLLQKCSFLDLRSVEVLVLDEADRLLDMGFKKQLDSLMDRLPRQRRTGLFSATQTEAVQALARAGLRNPVRVNVAVAPRQQDPPSNPDDNREAPSARSSKKLNQTTTDSQPVAVEPQQSNQQLSLSQITPSTLSVHYTVVETAAKVPQLAAFLAAHASEKIIVYFLTCACVDYFALALPRLPPCRQLALHALHGRMRQHSREAVLEAFATSLSGVLLATDVAARGLDIPNVHWVVQFDAPQDPSAFVHRCGRTARMGRSGQALAYVTPAEVPYADFLRLRKIPLAAAAPLNTDKDCWLPQQRVHNGGGSSSKGKIVHHSREAKGCEMVEQFNPNDAHSNETADIDKNDSVDGNNGNLFSGALGMLRKAAESDRALMEAGTKAFVSYIRAYKEHHCRYIFRMDDLRLGQLAASFALLRLPRMPEVKKAARNAAAGGDVGAGLKLLDGFEPSQIDPDTIKFRDKTREKQRQAVLKQRAARDESLQGVSKRPKRGDKHDGKLVDGRDKQSKAQGAVDAGQRLPAAKRRQLEMRQEFEDLNDEYALLRKLKRGKISQREYDVAVGLSSDDDDVDVDMEGKAGSGGNDSDDDEVDGTRAQKSSIAEAKARLGTRNYVEDALKKKARRKKKQKGRKTNNMF